MIYLGSLGAISYKQGFQINMRRLLLQHAVQILCVLIVCLAAPRMAAAQISPSVQTPAEAPLQNTQTGPHLTTPPAPASSSDQSIGADPGPGDSTTLFPHSNTSRY